VTAADGGHWVRRQCLLMARSNRTPVGFWLGMPLHTLGEWIRDSNDLIREDEERMRKI